LNNLKNTYLGGFYREAVDGIMHPFFPTHLVSTYRGSADSPNFTNIPKRDKQAKRITRRAIIPRPGRQILDVDFKGIEVCMGACNSHDPKLIIYVSDPTTDMHRDQAMEIYFLSEKQVSDGLRQGGKNAFVFPQFYGSYWGNCAPDLWQYAKENTLPDGTPTLEHLRDEGIKSYSKFEKHIEDVEDEFWNVKFAVYRDWKDSMWKFYQRHGYIELPTGHRCYWSPRGLLTRKECMNYPNQGPGFRCLLLSMDWLDDIISEKNGWSSKMIGQIHDDIVWDLEPSELKDLWAVLQQVMCKDIREYWPWIIVPLEIEGEVTEVNGNWNEQQEIQL
jgi:DNA polymerase I-like protein with 3'-5' exonuclease and polymerase domains